MPNLEPSNRRESLGSIGTSSVASPYKTNFNLSTTQTAAWPNLDYTGLSAFEIVVLMRQDLLMRRFERIEEVIFTSRFGGSSRPASPTKQGPTSGEKEGAEESEQVGIPAIVEKHWAGFLSGLFAEGVEDKKIKPLTRGPNLEKLSREFWDSVQTTVSADNENLLHTASDTATAEGADFDPDSVEKHPFTSDLPTILEMDNGQVEFFKQCSIQYNASKKEKGSKGKATGKAAAKPTPAGPSKNKGSKKAEKKGKGGKGDSAEDPNVIVSDPESDDGDDDGNEEGQEGSQPRRSDRLASARPGQGSDDN